MEDQTYLLRGSFHTQKSSIIENPKVAGWILLGYSLLGVVTFIWAFWTQRHRLSTFKQSMILSFTGQNDKLRGVQSIHYTLIPLLFIDAMAAVTEFGSAMHLLFESFCPNCAIMTYTWLILRCLGLVFHFVNALACILYLYNPLWVVKARCLAHFVTFLVVILFVFFIEIALLGHEVLILLLGLFSMIAQFKVTPPSLSAAVHRRKIALVAMLNFLLVFAPAFVLNWLMMTQNLPNYTVLYGDVTFGTNFHIYIDGILCYFILKLPSEEEQQQQQQHQHQHQQDLFHNPNYTLNISPSQSKNDPEIQCNDTN